LTAPTYSCTPQERNSDKIWREEGTCSILPSENMEMRLDPETGIGGGKTGEKRRTICSLSKQDKERIATKTPQRDHYSPEGKTAESRKWWGREREENGKSGAGETWIRNMSIWQPRKSKRKPTFQLKRRNGKGARIIENQALYERSRTG